MNLKSKIFAIAAAGLLSVGAAGGMALADTTSNPSVTLTLDGGTTTCSGVLMSASLGTYHWVDSHYVRDDTDTGELVIAINVSEAQGKSGDRCDVSASLGVLQNEAGNQITNFQFNLDSANDGVADGTATFNSPHPLALNSKAQPDPPSQLGTNLAAGVQYTWTVEDISSQLLSQPMPGGTYTGVLTLTGHVSDVP